MKRPYVLVTPVHNEEQLLDLVIKSVVAQTFLPQAWVIVNDGSTDRTRDIIAQYEKVHNFIFCLDVGRHAIESYYGRRTLVVLEGCRRIKQMGLDYDYLGVLDADITLNADYYEGILSELDRNSRLGIAAGVYFYLRNGKMQGVLRDRRCTPGSIHVFRRECYEQIGGYIPLKYGGDDSLCDIMARMHGWETQNFPQYKVIEHRPVGTGDGRSIINARFRQGLTEYGIATHPIFMIAKSMRRAVLERPYLIGSMARLAGFVYGYCLREKRVMPPEAISYVRTEQLKRLLHFALER